MTEWLRGFRVFRHDVITDRDNITVGVLFVQRDGNPGLRHASDWTLNSRQKPPVNS